MSVTLDSGGLSGLVQNRQRIAQLLKHGLWPPLVPAPVLTESLTGDHRRDHHINRLLKQCDIREVTEVIARHGASLRTSAHRSAAGADKEPEISATDAIVVATADHAGGGTVLTADSGDLGALARHTVHAVHIAST
jgi:predicted nucleic acid-binding protein